MRRTSVTIGPAAALALTAAYAGGDADTSGDGDSSPGGYGLANDGNLMEIVVGGMPIVDTAAIWLGVAEGIFEDHSLELDLELAQGGAAIVPAVVSGDYQFGFSNLVSLFVAADQGLPLAMISPANATTGDTAADIGALVTTPDSDILSSADLAGHKVAVNTLNNINEPVIGEAVPKDRGDPSEIEYLEMGFSDIPVAVTSGQVDAAFVLEPFSRIAQEQGTEVTIYGYVEANAELMVAAYFSTEQYPKQEPKVVESFTAAMSDSLEYAQANPEDTRDILTTYTEIDTSSLTA